MAARTAFGVGARRAPTWGKAKMSVATPLVKPMSGDVAPVMPATMERLSEPPMGALPTMPETTQPTPWPASSFAGPSGTTEMMARKSTQAKAVAETRAEGKPPRRSKSSPHGISQGQRRTQPKRPNKPSATGAASAGALGGTPTTSPAKPHAMARSVPAAVATMTSMPGRRRRRVSKFLQRSTRKSVRRVRATAPTSQTRGCVSIQNNRYMAALPPGSGVPPRDGRVQSFFTAEPLLKTAPEVWAATTVIAKPSFQPDLTAEGMYRASFAAPEIASSSETTPTSTEKVPSRSIHFSSPKASLYSAPRKAA
mmetsp:Transcript_49901/g.139686  ORF Transcript_49901/g.139686 Transcript_49901/m.139686 type:complete len:310 (+) Transcript_49901:453-1382(+)